MYVSRGRLALSVKRGVDIVGAVLGFVVLAPVFGITSFAILATQGRPIFFRQMRPGLHGRPFRIVKFRTMRAAQPGDNAYATDAVRTPSRFSWYAGSSH